MLRLRFSCANQIIPKLLLMLLMAYLNYQCYEAILLQLSLLLFNPIKLLTILGSHLQVQPKNSLAKPSNSYNNANIAPVTSREIGG